MKVHHLYISKQHNFVGHHGSPPGETPIEEVEEVECVEGLGLRGDRYFDHKPGYKGQITFFSEEVFKDLCDSFQVPDVGADVLRRNVLVAGVDLNDFIGREFELQGIRFLGVEECRPCYWMDQAFAEGAEEAMRGRGGLRAKILSSGTLRVDQETTDAASPA
ncbi:MAG: MOSC domain-containing protein [Verrucomicrobiales bacterium]